MTPIRPLPTAPPAPRTSRPRAVALHRATVASAVAVALAVLVPRAHALPMASQDSWMVMGDFSADASMVAANLAVTRRDAPGVMAARWEEMPHAGAPKAHAWKREAVGLTLTRLVHRWNLPHAQANLWAVGSLGAVRASERPGTQTLWSLAGLADFETTRVYLGAGLEAKRARHVRHDTASLRAGFSFYEVEYEDIQPWLILQAKRERFHHMSEDTVTPMLRLIHRRWFVEAGGNRKGGVFNVMLSY